MTRIYLLVFLFSFTYGLFVPDIKNQIGKKIKTFELNIRQWNISDFPESFSIIIYHEKKTHSVDFFPDPLFTLPNINLLNEKDQTFLYTPNKKINFYHYKPTNGNGYATVIKNSKNFLSIIGSVTTNNEIFSISPDPTLKRLKRSSESLNHQLFIQNLTDFKFSCGTKYKEHETAKKRTFRSERANEDPLVINVETVAVLDISVYNHYKNLVQSSDLNLILENIRVYYAHVINSVNQKYQNSLSNDPDIRINIRLTNILVASNVKESIWSDRSHVGDPSFPFYGNREVIIIGKALSKLSSYLNSLELNFEFDHAVGITRKDIWTDFIRNDITGGTINAGVCHDQMKYSIVEEYNPAMVPYIIAHEIGHNLGGLHDGEGSSSSCSSADNFILSTNPSLSKNFENLQKFSPCSIANFKQVLLKNGYFSPNFLCLKNDPLKSSLEIYDPKLIGQNWDIDDQCRLKIGHDSTNDFTTVQNLCSNLDCNKGFATFSIGPALDGTQCATGSMCINKVCVKSPMAAQSKCPFRDQLIYQWMDDLFLFYEISKTCSEYFSILESNKYSIYNYCKNGPGSKYCCSLCTIYLQMPCYDTQDLCPTDSISCAQPDRQISCRKSCGLCQTKPVKCNSETFICENGGKCMNLSQPVNNIIDFKCLCPTGFTGLLCSRKAAYLQTTTTTTTFSTTFKNHLQSLSPSSINFSTRLYSTEEKSSFFEDFTLAKNSTVIISQTSKIRTSSTEIIRSTWSKSTKKNFGKNKCKRRKRKINR